MSEEEPQYLVITHKDKSAHLVGWQGFTGGVDAIKKNVKAMRSEDNSGKVLATLATFGFVGGVFDGGRKILSSNWERITLNPDSLGTGFEIFYASLLLVIAIREVRMMTGRSAQITGAEKAVKVPVSEDLLLLL